jgi:hypothetical protein
MPYDEAVKQRAYELDPECWESYIGKPKEFKRAMDARRTAALRKARRIAKIEEANLCTSCVPSMKPTLDNAALQMLLAVTLGKLAELCHVLPHADDWTEQFMELRDEIAWRA